MFVMRVEGGLGNQLFMYCKARDIQIRSGLKVALDVSYFYQNKRNISGPNQELFWLENYRIKYNKLIRSNCVFQRREMFFDLFNFYDDTDQRIEKLDKDPKKLNYHYLRGFWQDENLFNEIRFELLQDDLRLKSDVNSPILDEIKNSEMSVGLSVRRGDFLKCNDRPTMSKEYYLNCADMILEKFPDATFFLFSDDDNWVAENISPNLKKSIQVKRSICYEDLYILSQCNHHIIPNSTFSWWGAWMCQNPSKIVIGPKHWNNFGSGNIMPKSWISVPVL